LTLRIADTFTASLARLNAREQAAAKQTAFDLQVDPTGKGLSLHRVDRSRDPDFWTVRVNRDIRAVIHRRGPDTLLAYVGHHDDAYRWAERRRLEVHPMTGAAQLVEVRERVEEEVVPIYRAETPAKPPLFATTPKWTLLLCGVPEDWLDDVRAATEDTLFDLGIHLPAETVEALLNLATGVRPALPPAMVSLSTSEVVLGAPSGLEHFEDLEPLADPFEHPDALRHFRVIKDEEELRRALEAPWDAWTIFLHPAQREFVTRDFAGPARVTGSAGTGKTVVALHRAARLAREGGRVLLVTFNAALAASLAEKFARLVGDEAVRARVEIADLGSAATRLHERLIGPVRLASEEDVRDALLCAREAQGFDVDERFLIDEWRLIVDARDVRDADAYRDLPRLGRKRRLAGDRRERLWSVFGAARASLEARGLSTYAAMLHRLAAHLEAEGQAPFDHVVVDEAQDIALPELRLLGAMAGDRPNGLFFAGDIGQRIFRPAFSWRSLGVDVTGRSRSLKVNYRTSRQIRSQADGLLPSTLVEIDGAEESRRGVQSVFEGPQPEVRAFKDEAEEIAAVGEWLRARLDEGMAPGEIGVLIRSPNEAGRARAAIAAAGEGIAPTIMHDAKGREYRAVAVMACDEAVIPSEERLIGAADEAAQAEVYATERHLLYVACTRARERLLVTSVRPSSEFLDDLTR